MSFREKRIKSVVKIYYANPEVQKVIFDFSKDREVVPSFMMEHFGKRPDVLQYPADIMGAVNRGATSLHCSEEIWENALEINSEMTSEELDKSRSAWDLLIDIDSPFLDYSKIAARLILESLEKHGVKNVGIKFSGSKGFHLIVPSSAFPEEFEGQKTKEMFPEWPRAISQYLMNEIKTRYNKIVSDLEIDFKALEERTKLKKEDVVENVCPSCGAASQKGIMTKMKCDRCDTLIEKRNHKATKRKLKCIDDYCPGHLEIVESSDFFYCDNCKATSFDKTHESDKKVVYSKGVKSSFIDDFKEEVSGEAIASLDLVLVAPRHLFRMPYSLHEKTALASVVLKKEEIDSFTPKDANPLKVKIRNFYPSANKDEAINLLKAALAWKKINDAEEESEIKKKYRNYEKIEVANVKEDMFPKPIKKLLKGLKEGRKRGLFILLTFYKSLNFSPEYINDKAREWNEKNEPPLREGYVKSQIEWHLRQKKQILPPNYANKNFYKDLNLLDSEPKVKNPIVEVLRKIRKEY